MNEVSTLALVGTKPTTRHMVTIRRAQTSGGASVINVVSACGVSWSWHETGAHHFIQSPWDAEGSPRGRTCLRCEALRRAR